MDCAVERWFACHVLSIFSEVGVGIPESRRPRAFSLVADAAAPVSMDPGALRDLGILTDTVPRNSAIVRELGALGLKARPLQGQAW